MRLARTSAIALLFLPYAFAQPAIDGIVNAASYTTAPSDASGNQIGNNIIAQGSIFAVFGRAMGPTILTYAAGLPLPTSVPDSNGTSIAIASGGKTVNAFMVYTSAGQLAAIMPSTATVGDATLTVAYNGKTSVPAKITVVKSQLGIFTANAQGTGPAASQHGADSSPIQLTTAAKPGETIVLYGTGLGPIATADNIPPGAVPVGSNVIVTVAGKVVTPDYAGRSPNFPGLDQINFKVPADVTTGCYVPASVTASGQVSQDFVLSIAAAGASVCTHPLGLNQSALATLDSGGTVNVGLFQMLRAYVAFINNSLEGAGGLFDNVNANGVFQMYNRIPAAFGAAPYPAPLNGCVVIDQVITGSAFSVPDFSLIGGKELIPHPIALNVSGPGNAQASLSRSATGGYLGLFLQPILGPGSWSIIGNGGPDVGPFNAKITLPDNLVWTNLGNFSNVPLLDLTITWTGGNAPGNPVVTIFGNSTVVNAVDPSKSRAKSFYCAAPASAGKFVVTREVRQQLPLSSTVDGETSFGSLAITSGGFAGFTAPLTKGTLDAGTIAYGEATVLTVKYQ
jgi:uncharacterized protein (TIGR03437 family)